MHRVLNVQVQVTPCSTNNEAVSSIGYQHVPSFIYRATHVHDSRCTKVQLQTTMDLTNRPEQMSGLGLLLKLSLYLDAQI
jgi:hypothetical protein